MRRMIQSFRNAGTEDVFDGIASGDSIRINEQYRICFVWKDGHAYQVEIADYH